MMKSLPMNRQCLIGHKKFFASTNRKRHQSQRKIYGDSSRQIQEGYPLKQGWKLYTPYAEKTNPERS